MIPEIWAIIDTPNSVERAADAKEQVRHFPMQKREKISSRISGVAVSPVMHPISSAAVRSELPASSHDSACTHSQAASR